MKCPLPCEACECHQRFDRLGLAYDRLFASFVFVFVMALLMCAAVVYLAVTS